MNVFSKTREYNDIIVQLNQYELLNKVATFECYTDSIFVYSYKEESFYHEFCIIADTDFLAEVKIIELLAVRNTSYFDYRIIHNSECIYSCRWSLYDTIGLN